MNVDALFYFKYNFHLIIPVVILVVVKFFLLLLLFGDNIMI